MPPRTSPAYWPKRILLAIGVLSVAVILVWGVAAPLPADIEPLNLEFGPVSIDCVLLGRGLAVGVPVLGLLWMVRVFRESEGDPPPWRHRDH